MSIAHIAELWRTAQTTPLHGPSCSCHGGGQPIMLDARALEADLLDYLIPRYRKENADGLVRALERRKKEPLPNFLDWLDRADISDNDRQRLLGDIEASLTSLCAHAEGA